MPNRRHVLTPEAPWMMDTIAPIGSLVIAGSALRTEPMVREHVGAGHLLVKSVQRPALSVPLPQGNR